MSKKEVLRSFNPNDFEVVESNSVTSFDPNEFEVVSAPKIEKDPFALVQEREEKKHALDNIINSVPDIDDGRKQILRDITSRGVKGDDLRDAILTLQGKHHKQSMDGSIKYYLDDKGIPRALANNEPPPKGYDINSIWGEKADAEDDSALTTLGKNVFNILPSVAENAIDLVHLPYGAIAGKEADWYKTLKNSANYLKTNTSEASKAPVLNTEGIDEFSEVFDPKRWDFTADNVAGTVGQILKSVGEFTVGGGFVSKAVGATTKLGKGASLFTASYATQLGETIDRGKEAGLTTEDAYRVGSAINVPVAMVDLALGVEGRIFKDATAKAGRKELVDGLVKGFIKDSEGKVTKEGLDELFKATLVANTALVKNWGKQTLGDVVGEGSQEALQAFIQNSGEQLYDKMSDENKAKFGTDAFSGKSFADYLQNFVVGAIGGAPSGIAYNKIKAITKENEQSKTAFGLVQQKEGEDIEATNTRINAYKANIANEVKQGKLTQEQADNALTRINSYKDYNDMIGSLPLDETNKRQLFDLSFQKQALETEIAGIKNPEKLNPIEQAQYNVKEKFATDLQKQINEIVLKAQVQEETVLSEKTINDVDKLENPTESEGKKKTKLNPVSQAIADKYKKDAVSKKEYPEEKRSYEEVKTDEFNKFHPRVIHKLLSEKLNKLKDRVTTGTVLKRSFNEGKNHVFEVEMEEGKKIRFSSSMIREDEWKDGHLMNAIDETVRKKEGEFMVIDRDKLAGKPVALKSYTIENDGRKKNVVKIYNPENGKFIAWAKETKGGKNDYTQEEINGKDGLIDIERIIEPIPPTSQGETVTPIKPQPKPVLNVQQPTKDEFVASQIEALKNDPDSDYEPYLEESGLYEKHFTEQYQNTFGKKESVTTENTGDRTQSNSKRKGKKGTPKSRQKIKDPRYKKALALDANTPTEVVMQYFIGGGKINPSAIDELYKHAGKEKQARLSYLNKNAPSIEMVAHYLWEDQDHQRWDDTEFKEAVENVVNGYTHPTRMAEDLLEAHNENRFDPKEQSMIQVMDEAEKANVLTETEEIIDKLEEKSDDDIQQFEGDVPFQKVANVKGNAEKVVAHIQKVLPKIKVVYDAKLKSAGKLSADGKTISINPYYAGIDTPIHEGGHVLIDAMGYNNPTIQSAVKQLRDTDLYKETAKRYSELKGEMLDKEVLAEAIGREGAGIFDVEVKRNAFLKLLDKIFEYFKTKLGLDKNVAKTLAKQLIRGEFKESKGTNTGVEQAQVIGIEGAENLGKEVQGALDLAIKMFNTQRNAKQIKAATGWEYDSVDKKWKYETDDSKMEVRGSIKEISDYLKSEGKAKTKLKVSEFVSNFETLKAYPEFKDVTINFYRDNDLSNIASYDANKKQLNINVNTELNDRGTKKTIAHELQHAIQLREGFARGGNFSTTYAKVVKRMAQEKGKSINELSKSETQQAANESDRLYHLSAGEVEARNVESRLDKTAEERRNSLLSETEDLNRGEEKIYSYTGNVFNKQEFSELQKDLETIENDLENETDEDTIAELEAIRDVILENIEALEQENEDFKKGIVRVKEVASAENLEGFTLDELIEAYDTIKSAEGFIDKEELNDVKLKIAHYLNQEGKQRLEKQYGEQITKDANKKDLKWNDIWFKTLGHISQDFPELQEFYKIFNQGFLDMQTERVEKKGELERLGKAVISEYNKKMGVGARALNLFSSNSAKYFDYLDKDGKFRADTKGLSKAQIDLLNFMKGLVKERQVQGEDIEVIKIDKGFRENWKEGGLMDAIANYMGGSNQDAEIQLGGKQTTYKDAQKVILADAKKGLAQKSVALLKLLQVAYKAKKGSEKSNYGLNYNGQLTSKFDQPRDKDKGYSKDFYSAAMSYIDDLTHTKNMGKLVPLVDSIEQFYKYLGFEQGKSFGNVLKFIEQWKSTQIYQRAGETDPIIDKTLQFFRRLTSMTVMGYNYGAGGVNLMIGNYNSLRSEGLTNWVKGQSRLFGGKDRAGLGTINKKAADILKKYDVVQQDFDSNPKAYAGKLFDLMAFGATRFGEYQIQGTLFLGQIEDKIWDSFEKNSEGDYVLKKGADEKEIKQKMLKYKDVVSDIQGKYSSKDAYNITRFELGKSSLQFKLWIGSWLKSRYGGEYIDANNVLHRGSWNMFTEQAIKELRNDWSKHNIAASWKNKQLRQNLSGAITVAVLYALTHADDEDKKKRKQALSLENAYQQVLFVYDPQQAKYLLESPVASVGTMKKFIDALDLALHGEGEKAGKQALKVVPYNKGITKAVDLIKEN